MATPQGIVKRRGSLRDLKTAVTARIRSKPTIEGQQYLDLYVLQRDRFRWKRLMDQAQRSIQSIDQALLPMGFNPDGGHRRHMSAHAGSSTTIPLGVAKTIDLGITAKRKRAAGMEIL